jgi:mRNA interferase RelE/StbE
VQIKFKNSALKDLKKLNKAEIDNIIDKIDNLQFFPNVINVKKLTNFFPPYRLRVGNYRILFELNEKFIIIYGIKHRKDSYK